ncbi:MAG: methenyltetrahydromethanopterin cyclohydrolase [Ignisphaera sp.]|nr:methenyltetrahydromethanopterin cyclohydrolase [Ignisphaera sp.]MCX8168251.1 methenyltetrahydromethanopterin cyclohydrolase [Ignisphaera sp.]MDW8084881.1 methenyltetrahydromethanopterin cyclohydrolase [Ignisphaera sp.]
MNKLAVNLIKEGVDLAHELKVEILNVGGATVIDAGVKVGGSVDSGILVSKVCLGGLASVSLTPLLIEDMALPAIAVSTDYPIESCIASQLAGWRIKVGEFFANGSGPARVLAKKPRKLFESIGYTEQSDEAALVLETSRIPNEDVIKYISSETGVEPKNIYIVVVAPNSIAGTVQVSARIVETGIFKLNTIGFDIKCIKYGFGVCPIAPIHPDPLVMMGRTNDMLLYGGSTYYVVSYPDDAKLREYVNKTPSSSSRDYGKSFVELVKQFGEEILYKVDPNIFAPATVTVNNISSGRTFKAGYININVIKSSIALSLV